MSYLDPPRIHFGGRFFTDPSTVNNDPVHYKVEKTDPSPWQNPFGQHRFILKDCQIKSAVGASGELKDDLVVGKTIESTDKPSAAKIADLDVYQQGVPTIFGLQVRIPLTQELAITGTADPLTLNQMWTNSVLPTRSWNPEDYAKNSYGGDMNMCGWFQSVIRVKVQDWPQSDSAALNELREATIMDDGDYLISIRFTLDGYRNVPENADYQTGRIVGTLGPVLPGEPLYNSGQRSMAPRSFNNEAPWYYPAFNDCPFKVDANRKKLVLDLANSICRTSAGGDPVDLGLLQAYTSTPDPVVLDLGTVDYSAFNYDSHAHIVELDLSDVQLQTLDKGPLYLQSNKSDIGDPKILSENAGRTQIEVEVRPVRIQGTPGNTASAKVYVSSFGKPLANKQLSLDLESVHGTTGGATVPPSNPGNTPQAEGALEATIGPTDANGYAEVTIKVLKDPGQRTPELDGQLYFIVVYDPKDSNPEEWKKNPNAPPQTQTISVLAWSHYEVNPQPEWSEVKSILAPYMKLFPYMKDLMDVTDSKTFQIFAKNPPWEHMYPGVPPGPLGIKAGTLPFYLSRDFEDPRYMPVTRDLSPNKIMTILHFIKNFQDAPVNEPS